MTAVFLSPILFFGVHRQFGIRTGTYCPISLILELAETSKKKRSVQMDNTVKILDLSDAIIAKIEQI